MGIYLSGALTYSCVYDGRIFKGGRLFEGGGLFKGALDGSITVSLQTIPIECDVSKLIMYVTVFVMYHN